MLQFKCYHLIRPGIQAIAASDNAFNQAVKYNKKNIGKLQGDSLYVGEVTVV
jgi:hypothetical protein